VKALPQLRQGGSIPGGQTDIQSAQLVHPLCRVREVLATQRAKLLRQAVIRFG
jgi:hypothetical protein